MCTDGGKQLIMDTLETDLTRNAFILVKNE